MNGVGYHHGDLRNALIAQAVEVVGQKGVEGVSLRGLARLVGVSHAAPLRHFPNRGALLAAVLTEGVTALLAGLDAETSGSAQPARARLAAITQRYVGWARANPVHHLLLRNQDVMRHADADLKRLLKRYADLQLELTERAQREGWRAGEPAAAVRLEVIAFTAGLALAFSDPLYVEVLDLRRDAERLVRQAITGFFGLSEDQLASED